MEMPIDKCIEKLAHEKQCFIDEGWENDGELESYDMAIDIMHKYQQIEQILDDCDLEAWEVLEMIKEVVADGNE